MFRRFLAPILVALLFLACSARWLGGQEEGTPEPPAAETAGPQVVFPSVTVSVELARTEAERTKGLGGHAPLGEQDGMLFIFEGPGLYTFWMKGMTFPLDIMWVEEGQVVHLETDVPPPTPDSPDVVLPLYSPAAPASYVLEVNAGFARAHDIGVGTPVQITGL